MGEDVHFLGDTRLTEVDAHKHHTLTTTKDHDNHQPAQGKGTERKEKKETGTKLRKEYKRGKNIRTRTLRK